MAEMPSNVPPLAPSAPTLSTGPATGAPNRGASKLALMLAFAAGAAFAWFLIVIVISDDDSARAPVVAPPGSTVIQKR